MIILLHKNKTLITPVNLTQRHIWSLSGVNIQILPVFLLLAFPSWSRVHIRPITSPQVLGLLYRLLSEPSPTHLIFPDAGILKCSGCSFGSYACMLSCSVVSDCEPMNCSLPGSSVHRIFQVRILEWVAIFFFRGSSWSKDWTHISCIAGGVFTCWAIQ